MSLVLEFVSCVVKNLVNVSEEVMDGWVQNPKALQKALTDALCPPETASEQLGPLKRVTTTTATGVQRFVCDDEALKAANVGWTGDNFNRLFRDKVEENVSDVKLDVSQLERDSSDALILTELGDKAEAKLAYLFDLLKKQANGQDGVLLTNGYANIFYIRGTDNNLWAVSVNWYFGNQYWGVEAHSIENPDGWFDGRQVFSCDS